MRASALPLLILLFACPAQRAAESPRDRPVASLPTRAQTADGSWISWSEHLIDSGDLAGGAAVAGSDGLTLGDLDRDGHDDVISVHESDTTYDGVADGLVRIAFASEDPDRWELTTLAEGEEAGAAEDAAVGDVDGDGFPDVVVACELAHLLYLQNPGRDVRTSRWPRVIPPATRGRGSFIRVFLADFDGDGRPEVVTANKGAQNPDPETTLRSAISWFALPADPLDGAAWEEHELTRVRIPINARPVDLDEDGDVDVIGGSRGERRIFWFENRTAGGDIDFVEHPIDIEGVPAFPEELTAGYGPPPETAQVTGFNLDFLDLSDDGRLDIVLVASGALAWLEQPAEVDAPWTLHTIGTILPDHLVGFIMADIDGDGLADAMTGAYSRGPRDEDGAVSASDPLGRIAWFHNPGPGGGSWIRHDVSRRKRGMFDKFVARDLDRDGDTDFLATRGNSAPFDGVFWLEQVRTGDPLPAFDQARESESEQMPLP